MFRESPRIRTLTGLTLLAGVGCGTALLLVSYLGNERYWPIYVTEFLRDAGIVIASVFTVHFLYEKTVARDYFETFERMLEARYLAMDSLSASARRWGIAQYYDNRSQVQQDDALRQRLAGMRKGTRFRMVARTGIHLTTARILREALDNGAQIELCLLNPNAQASVVSLIPGLTQNELRNGFEQVYEHFIKPLKSGGSRSGTFRLRLHDIPLFDSYFRIENSSKSAKAEGISLWDLSFGYNFEKKRAIKFDKTTPDTLAADLATRYDALWATATSVFVCEEGTLVKDSVSDVVKLAQVRTGEHDM